AEGILVADVVADCRWNSTVGCRTVVGGANVSDPSAPLRYGRDDGAPGPPCCMMADQVQDDGGRSSE
ncbi:MAG: hypothetical protein V3T49_02340, partial [Dehalococcoidia bacterium]